MHAQTSVYDTLLSKLYDLSRGKSRLDLTNMHALHDALGAPAKQLRTIHIAGTNGKGSTTTKIAHALTLSGYKVGRYTSPHISSFRERICINGRPISKEQLCAYLPALLQQADALNVPYSFFEVTTLLAFCFFAEEQVDVAVIETGLGGRLDATNVIHPILSVITSISLDHTMLLGTSRDQIAREKGGIIKPRVPVVLGPHANLPVLHDMARSLHAPVHLSPSAFGDYDAENRAIAKTALDLLQETWSIPQTACLEGLLQRPPCRIEEVPSSTLARGILASLPCLPKHILLDVAHNPDGILRLLESIALQFPGQPIHVLCAFSEDKDVESMLHLLLNTCCGMTVSAAQSPRALSMESLLHLARSLAPNKSIEGRAVLSDALTVGATQAVQAGLGSILLICGTFFIMSEVRQLLGFQEERDTELLHEGRFI